MLIRKEKSWEVQRSFSCYSREKEINKENLVHTWKDLVESSIKNHIKLLNPTRKCLNILKDFNPREVEN